MVDSWALHAIVQQSSDEDCNKERPDDRFRNRYGLRKSTYRLNVAIAQSCQGDERIVQIVCPISATFLALVALVEHECIRIDRIDEPVQMHKCQADQQIDRNATFHEIIVANPTKNDHVNEGAGRKQKKQQPKHRIKNFCSSVLR